MIFRIGKENNTIMSRLWLLITMTIVVYMFFIQYGIGTVNGLLIVLSVLTICFSAYQIIIVQHCKLKTGYLDGILLFAFLSTCCTVFISSGGRYGVDESIRLLEYVLVGYSTYLLCTNYRNCLKPILWAICFSISLVAIVGLTKGVEISTSGAIGVATLNGNVMATYFIIMIFSSFLLFGMIKRRVVLLALLAMDCIVIISQVLSASRRGFIVLLMFLFLSITFGVIPLKSNTHSKRRLFLYILLILVLLLAALFIRDYVIENTILGARLSGQFNGGDAARDYYQSFALSQFLSHPLLGIGLGGIQYNIGMYSHSMYYEILACTGVVCSAIFFVALLRIGRCFTRVIRYRKVMESPSTYYYACLGAIYLICIFVSGIAVVSIYDIDFYFVLGVLAAIAKITNDEYVDCIKLIGTKNE